MRAELVLFAVVVGGCAVDLDEAPAKGSSTTTRNVPALQSCELFAELEGLSGLARPIVLPDGRELTLAAQADFDGRTSSAAFEGDGPCGAGATPSGARPMIDATALGEGTPTPRAGFVTDTSYLYFSLDRGFESQGAGIARYDAEAEAFVAVTLLWTSDRPSYGSAAIVDGEYVYVYGGTPARFLSADVYLARAPLDRALDSNAYEYFQGGGAWTTDPDLAGALLEGGATPSVMWHADSDRYLMAYATPLSREVSLRSGLGPAGPWSRPLPLGLCALPFADAFCGDVAFLPAFAGGGELALSQTVVAFDAPKTATTRDYWTRLVTGRIPAALP